MHAPADALPADDTPPPPLTLPDQPDDAPPPPLRLPDLPDDVLLTILAACGSAECVVAVARTCRALHRVACDPWLWREAAGAAGQPPIIRALAAAAAAALRAPPTAASLIVTVRVAAFPRSAPPALEATLLPHPASLRVSRAAAAAELVAGLTAQRGGPVATAELTERGHAVRATLCPAFCARAAAAAGKRAGWPPETQPPLPPPAAPHHRRRRVAPVDLGLFSSLMFDWSAHAASCRAAAHARLTAAAARLLPPPAPSVRAPPRATWPLVIAAGEDGMESAAKGALAGEGVGAPPAALVDAAITLALLSPRLSPSRPAAFGGAGAPLSALRDGAAIVAEVVRWRQDGAASADADADLANTDAAVIHPSTPADAVAAYLASSLRESVAQAAAEGGAAPVAALAAHVCAALRGAGAAGVAPAVRRECARTVAWCAWICAVDL